MTKRSQFTEQDAYDIYLQTGLTFFKDNYDMASLLHQARASIPMLIHIYYQNQVTNGLLTEIRDLLKKQGRDKK